MNKLQKFTDKFGIFLDPFIILGILSLFLIPTLTVLNLTPDTMPESQKQTVLGTTDTSTVFITPNVEKSDGIWMDGVSQIDDETYTFTFSHSAHKKGQYVNLIFTAENPTEDEKKLHIISGFEGVAMGTKVSVMVNDVKFVVLGPDGKTYPPTIYIQPDEKIQAYLVIENDQDVNFDSGFSLDLHVAK